MSIVQFHLSTEAQWTTSKASKGQSLNQHVPLAYYYLHDKRLTA